MLAAIALPAAVTSAAPRRSGSAPAPGRLDARRADPVPRRGRGCYCPERSHVTPGDRACCGRPTGSIDAGDRHATTSTARDRRVGDDAVDLWTDGRGSVGAGVRRRARPRHARPGLSLTGLDLSPRRLAGRRARPRSNGTAGPAAADRSSATVGTRPAGPSTAPRRRAELDRAGYGGSVYLSRVDAHSAVVSSALLGGDAWRRGTAELPGGRLAHDRGARRGARYAAFGSLTAAASPGRPAGALRHARLRSASAACTRWPAPRSRARTTWRRCSRWPPPKPVPEVVGYWGELLGIDTARELGAVGAAGDLFCDGSLGSHTAALHEPYADRARHLGPRCASTADELAEHIRRCDRGRAAGRLPRDRRRRRRPGARRVRAGGGRLAAVGRGTPHRARRDGQRPATARRRRAGRVDAARVRRGVGRAGRHVRRAARPANGRSALNRFAELAAAGVPLAFGSDSPVTPLRPVGGDQRRGSPVRPGRRRSAPAAAFAAHTAGGLARRPSRRRRVRRDRTGSSGDASRSGARATSRPEGLPDVSPRRRTADLPAYRRPRRDSRSTAIRDQARIPGTTTCAGVYIADLADGPRRYWPDACAAPRSGCACPRALGRTARRVGAGLAGAACVPALRDLAAGDSSASRRSASQCTAGAPGPRPGSACVYGAAFFGPLLHWTGVYVGPAPWLILAAAEAGFFAGMGAVLLAAAAAAGRASCGSA